MRKTSLGFLLFVSFLFASTALGEVKQQEKAVAEPVFFEQQFLTGEEQGSLSQLQFLANLPFHSYTELAGRVGHEALSFVFEPTKREQIYRSYFYKGLSLINDNNFPGAKEQFQALYREAYADGYRNLTTYSFVLIDIAKRLQQQGSHSEARYLVREALALSPEDARVRLAVIDMGLSEAVGDEGSFLFGAIALVFRYPSIILPLISNMLLVGLTASTIAFLVVCIIQIALYHRILYRVMMRKASRPVKNFIGPLVLLALLVGPLYFGLLPAVIVWSLLLSVNLNHGKWMGVLAGVLCICWGLGINVVSVTNENAHIKLNHALENAANSNYVPSDEQVLKRALEKFGHDPYVVFANGALFQHAGNLEKAERHYKAAIEIAGDDRPLIAASLGNLGILNIKRGDFDAGRKLLLEAEEKGASEFEVYRNMANLSLSSAQIADYRKYYSLLTEDFEDKLRAVEAREGEEPQYLMFGAPTLSFMKSFFRPPLDENLRMTLEERERHLAGKLMMGGSAERLIGVGILAIIISLVLARRGESKRFLRVYGSVKGKGGPSYIWMPFPAGRFIAGSYPVTGIVVFSLFAMCLMFHAGVPVRLFSVLPFPVESGSAFIAAAGAVFVIGLLGSLRIQQEQARV